MPSGITAPIYEGKDITRDEFLHRTARSYGLAVLQREDAPDAPVHRVKPDTKYHEDAIAKAEATLHEVASLTVEQARERAKSEHEQAVKDWEAAKTKYTALRSRYEAMIREVEAWEPPTLVAYIKEGALKYLCESLEFDCGEPGEEMRHRPYPQLLSGEEWINAKTEKARKDIDYHREQIAAEEKRAAERNAHIDAFLSSLDQGVANA